MRYNEILTEYRVENVGKGQDSHPVYVNPTKDMLINLLSSRDNLRGYYDNGDFYVWDAFYMNHDDVVLGLGLGEVRDDNCFYLEKVDGSIYAWLKFKSPRAEIVNSPYIKRIFKLIKNKRMFVLELPKPVEEKKILTKDKDPCWDGYRMYGTKKKGGKQVPNCVKEDTTSSTKPIEDAVMPLKTEAVDRAEQEARKIIDKVLSDFEKANWDLDVAAPIGDSYRDGTGYIAKKAKHFLYKSITTYVKPTTRRGEPTLRKKSPEAEQDFINTSKRDAAEQYDLFVGKLKAKIGPVVGATLKGSHVWGHSILTVVKDDGSTEHWKTQQIINMSKLGKLFNQWPTRKVKR